MARQILEFDNLGEVAECLKQTIEDKLGEQPKLTGVALFNVKNDEPLGDYYDEMCFVGYRRCFEFWNRQVYIEPCSVMGKIVIGEPHPVFNYIEFRYHEKKMGIRKRIKIDPVNKETIIRSLDGKIKFYRDELNIVADRLTGKILGA